MRNNAYGKNMNIYDDDNGNNNNDIGGYFSTNFR